MIACQAARLGNKSPIKRPAEPRDHLQVPLSLASAADENLPLALLGWRCSVHLAAANDISPAAGRVKRTGGKFIRRAPRSMAREQRPKEEDQLFTRWLASLR